MLMFRPLLRYADFRGRASRGEYLLFGMLQGLWYLLLLGLMRLAMGEGETAPAAGGAMVGLGLIFFSVLGLIVPNYAVLTRRLHDSGRGAVWLCLMLPSILSAIVALGTIASAVGAVGMGAGREAFVAAALTGLGAAGLLGLIGMIGQMVLVVITLLPGTRGPNRFGPDPRDPGAAGAPSLSSGLSGYDEARLDALIAQAKREQGHDGAPGSMRPTIRAEAATAGPGGMYGAPAQAVASQDGFSGGWDTGTAPARPFGRRNG